MDLQPRSVRNVTNRTTNIVKQEKEKNVSRKREREPKAELEAGQKIEICTRS